LEKGKKARKRRRDLEGRLTTKGGKENSSLNRKGTGGGAEGARSIRRVEKEG